MKEITTSQYIMVGGGFGTCGPGNSNCASGNKGSSNKGNGNAGNRGSSGTLAGSFFAPNNPYDKPAGSGGCAGGSRSNSSTSGGANNFGTQR